MKKKISHPRAQPMVAKSSETMQSSSNRRGKRQPVPGGRQRVPVQERSREKMERKASTDHKVITAENILPETGRREPQARTEASHTLVGSSSEVLPVSQTPPAEPLKTTLPTEPLKTTPPHLRPKTAQVTKGAKTDVTPPHLKPRALRPNTAPTKRTQQQKTKMSSQQPSETPSPSPRAQQSPMNRANSSSPRLRTQQVTMSTNMNGSAGHRYQGPQYASREPYWANWQEVKFHAGDLPLYFGTLEVYHHLKRFGNLTRIEVDRRTAGVLKAWVTFSPPPQSRITKGVRMSNTATKKMHLVHFRQADIYCKPVKSPVDPTRELAQEVIVTAERVQFGVMKDKNTMLVLNSATQSDLSPVNCTVNNKYKWLEIKFGLTMNTSNGTDIKQQLFRVRMNFGQMKEIFRVDDQKTGAIALVISVQLPPMVSRKAEDIAATHDRDVDLWTEWKAWYRQTAIQPHADAQDAVTQLQNDKAIIDVGRWLTYCAIFEQPAATSILFGKMCQALVDHSIPIRSDRTINFNGGDSSLMWSWLENAESLTTGDSSSWMPTELQEMARETRLLPFQTRYQLEVCISHGLLHESNITKEFLEKLSAMGVDRAVRLLEKVADGDRRFYNPDDIFRKLHPKASFSMKRLPPYCAIVRAVIVTPTTVYFTSPAIETSNRILRRYSHHADRFLRVKFTDEKYKGRMRSSRDENLDEIFSRLKRTLANGIRVGDRHYEYLASGNSQFREHGGWFFAPTADLKADHIRAWMGNFSHINVISKYCARLGQTLSTTRATQVPLTSIMIGDICTPGPNSYTFTDGVGKISPFLAHYIAQEHGLLDPLTGYPSVFQFRYKGSKGILVVDPTLGKYETHFRPSQEKFETLHDQGLEIIRTSQFSPAHLNIQLILVLSALGVKAEVFVKKMRARVDEIEGAMVDERKAVEELLNNVDFNNMSTQLASMIHDGFMANNDPFTISCLRLWNSYQHKYLKEKARILVEEGAFVLGCVDETATLKGYKNSTPGEDNDTKDPACLPEIFLQIQKKDQDGKVVRKVIEGVCILARNPSLHPGDVRVVRAVGVPALRHLKNCVALPQTGDRDLGSMCSGGDLDGDDYLVIWDETLIPGEWNHPPMDFTPPETPKSENITVDDMTSWFVTHMKYDNLALIACAHRYWADLKEDGVKDPVCLKYAQLHSNAVDFPKSSVPVDPREVRYPPSLPHWSEHKTKALYHSRSAVGKVYDEVERVPFLPPYELPFDERILGAVTLEPRVLQDARAVKDQWDIDIRRLMAKFQIKSDFEVWTTFVLEHSDDVNDYKFAETIGEAVSALKETYRNLCYEKAGTNEKDREWSKMKPFIAAMYAVTADEVSAAMLECEQTKFFNGREVPVRRCAVDDMPFMSFPWLFPTELGRIAKGDTSDAPAAFRATKSTKKAEQALNAKLVQDMVLPDLPEVILHHESEFFKKTVVVGSSQKEDLLAQALDLLRDEHKQQEPLKPISVAEVVDANHPRPEPMASLLDMADEDLLDFQEMLVVQAQSCSKENGKVASTPVVDSSSDLLFTPSLLDTTSIDETQVENAGSRAASKLPPSPIEELTGNSDDCDSRSSSDCIGESLASCTSLEASPKLNDDKTDLFCDGAEVEGLMPHDSANHGPESQQSATLNFTPDPLDELEALTAAD